MRIKLFFPWQQSKGSNGFLLLEVSLCLLIMLSLLLVTARGLAQIIPGWHRLYGSSVLYDAGHYTLSVMERNIVYDSAAISISKDALNTDKLKCTTIRGNIIYYFTLEGKNIYKTISKIGSSSSGKTALYVSDCAVEAWTLTKLSEKELLIELQLKHGSRRAAVRRILYCLNGSISNAA